MNSDKISILIISGMSGAGKSQAVRNLEDMGFFCIDNLPPVLISQFVNLVEDSNKKIDKVAIVADIRGRDFFFDLITTLNDLKGRDISYKILFLDAADDVLVKRYKELRRPHPLSPAGTLLEGIEKERDMMKLIREKADFFIDTSDMTNAKLRAEVHRMIAGTDENIKLPVVIRSFGFKHGTLADADLIFDVRFLPNPFYVEKLRPQDGRDSEVKNFVFNYPQTGRFVEKLIDLISFLLPYYAAEGKPELIIGIGCTGGQHRSVAIAEELGKRLRDMGEKTIVSHRDVGGKK